MKRGEIWVVEIPAGIGHEQYGSRPVCIVAETEANVAVIIPFTANLKALKFSNVLEIKPDKDNNLKETSIALVFQIRAIDKTRLKYKMGFLNDKTNEKINSLLKNFLEL